MRTQVAIIGGGPAGTLLAHLLQQSGIDCTVLERQSRAHVQSRIRAGVLEPGTVETLRAAGLAGRLDREGHVHDSINIAWRGEVLSIDAEQLVGRHAVAYGQTAIQEDLYRAADAVGLDLRFEVDQVQLHDLVGDAPNLRFVHEGHEERLHADFVVGCDGFHGVSRQAIPASIRREHEKLYPFGWLGILSPTPPLPILVYATHERGFGLCSMRNPQLSRYYVQCPIDDRVEDWSDDRFWSELLARLPEQLASKVVTGPSVEKSITPLRSFVSEPMRYGNLFLVGDAAHIVPPTGAKGLNLAVSDARYLARALADHYRGNGARLDTYSDRALARAWGSVRFSWWLTTMLHRFPESSSFDQRLQVAELNLLASSELARTAMAEQFVGLPFED